MGKLNHLTKRIYILLLLSFIACILYISVNIDLKYLPYILKLRGGKLAAMILTAFCIGSASIVFQSIIHNTIVTPCLLGMNSLYTLIHTSVVFFLGSGSLFARHMHLSYFTDLFLMGIIATFIYNLIFKKTNHNILYVLLIGTILTTFFSSIQSTMTRIMDPNEYDTLLVSLVASFTNINTEIISISALLMLIIAILFHKDLALLNVITLGKNQAINLGVDYDRTIRRLLLAVSLYIAIATAMVGPISFLGLIIANLSRQFLSTYKHSYLIAGSSFIGVIVLVFGQLISEHLFHYSIPVSVFITIGGGLYFLYLLLKERNQ